METTTAQIEEADERIGELDDTIMEKEEAEKKIKKIQEYEGRIRALTDAIKQSNIHIMVVPEEEKEDTERERS